MIDFVVPTKYLSIPWDEVEKWADDQWGDEKYSKGIRIYHEDGEWHWEQWPEVVNDGT